MKEAEMMMLLDDDNETEKEEGEEEWGLYLQQGPRMIENIHCFVCNPKFISMSIFEKPRILQKKTFSYLNRFSM